jgi:anti-sigma B factor antagonist
MCIPGSTLCLVMATNVFVVKLEGRKLDSGAAAPLRSKMSKAWESGASIAVLDMTDVTYIDSLGISALISEQRRRPAGHRIVLCSLCDYVRDVLEVTQIIRVFDIYASADAATAALSA